MPALSSYPTDSRTLPDLAQAELPIRANEAAAYWDYYEGRQKKHLKVNEGEPDYNVIINLCARVVDQSVNFLVGAPVTFDLPGDDEDTQAAEMMIQAWQAINDFPDMITDLMTMSAVTGHAFVKLVYEPERGNVRPVPLDASMVTAFWRADDKTLVVAYMIAWSETTKMGVVTHREDHILNDAGTGWDIITYTGRGGDWAEVKRVTWSYPFPAIVEWKNLPNPRGYYGRSDLAGVAALNDVYNFRESNTNKILFIHAHPRTVAIGVRKEEIQQTSVGGLWAIGNPDAKINNLEMQSDLESSRRQAADLKADFFSDGQTVDLSTVKDHAGQLTNFGLKLLFAEALAKNAKKRRLAERGLSEMIRRVGVMLGYDWDGATVQWGDPLPENTVEQVSTAKEVIAMGVSSTQTQAERLGYDWEREAARIQAEKAQQQKTLAALMMDGLRDTGGDDDEDENG
jgi:hypothetical protein